MDTRHISLLFAERAGIQPKEAVKIIESLGASIAGLCCNLDTVAIPGFGNFSATKKDEHILEDESTGQRKLIPPAIVPDFRPSVVLRKRLTK